MCGVQGPGKIVIRGNETTDVTSIHCLHSGQNMSHVVIGSMNYHRNWIPGYDDC